MWYRFAIVKKQTEELIGTGLFYFEDEVDGWEIAYNLSRKSFIKVNNAGGDGFETFGNRRRYALS